MSNRELEQLEDQKAGGFLVRGIVLVAFLIVVLGVYFYIFYFEKNAILPIVIEENVSSETSSATIVQVGPALNKSEPLRLRIPKINIDTGFVAPLGLEPNNEVSVPDSDTEVGWYQYSPTPGEIGPAVILGHVDSKIGPAVFFSLGQVDEGDDIFVDRADGLVAHFKVERLERVKQSEFPTEAVYGNINYAGLRLITCSGVYSKGTQRYSHNLVVYARLVE